MQAERLFGRARKAFRFLGRYGYSAASSLYLFTLGMRHPRHRALVTRISEHFGYPKAGLQIPETRLTDLVPDSVPVCVREMDAVDGNVTLYELVAICKLVAHVRPARVFEIGTFDGRTTLNLAANSADLARVFTLDLPRAGLGATALPVDRSERVFIEKQGSGTRFRNTDQAERITQMYGDSAAFDLEPYRRAIDFVFVDGSHAFEYVLLDSQNAMSMLSPRGGIVLWHDYGVWEGVTRALDQLFDIEPPFRRMRRIAGTSLVILDSRQP